MIKRYGILGTFRLVMSLIYTKIFFRQARLIRLPFDIRNKINIKIGKNFTAGFGCRIEAFPLDSKNKICIIKTCKLIYQNYVLWIPMLFFYAVIFAQNSSKP